VVKKKNRFGLDGHDTPRLGKNHGRKVGKDTSRQVNLKRLHFTQQKKESPATGKGEKQSRVTGTGSGTEEGRGLRGGQQGK